MSGKADAAVANRGCVKFMVVTVSTFAFAERAGPTPVILACRRDVAFTVDFVAGPAFFPIARPVLSCLMPSGFTRSSSAEWCRPIPIIETSAGSQPRRGYSFGRIVGRIKFASR